MTRDKLLTSREYWITLIANNLWNSKNDIDKFRWSIERCEREAKRIVDNKFMESINELYNFKHLI